MEFTGERLVPGQVDDDLYNEHMARYRFAARLARHRRVLEIACGAGYGSAVLAAVAESVHALDLAPEAALSANTHYRRANLHFLAAAAQQVPFADRSFDLIVAFEVLEHLADWKLLLSEARRLLAPGGQFIVSTPNKEYYTDSRGEAGSNPYHLHEFTYQEFGAELKEQFASVSLFLQNHVQGVAFQPVAGHTTLTAELAAEREAATPEQSHFFLAVCAASPQTGSPLYLYLPASSNVLREREQHIAKLSAELTQKNAWLDESRHNLAELHKLHEGQLGELRQANAWALEQAKDLEAARLRIVTLQDEVESAHRAGQQLAGAYEARLSEAHEKAAEQQRDLAADLAARIDELARCVELLHEAEKSLEERTVWAQSLQQRVAELEEVLRTAQGSRWLRLGRTLHIGPDLQNY